ncbi:MAG: hypothetical protein AB7K36_31550, partial [Chloroflexota bacterium]
MVQQPATVLVVVALVAAAAYFIMTIVDYSNLFVHPDNHQFILKESLRDGLAISPQDLVNSMQLRAEGESRPRWLTYLLLSIDQKLRLWLYDWLPTPPTLAPVSWLLQLVVTPYCLYRLLVNLTRDRLAGLASVAVYISAVGFLSGFTMWFMPGKTLSNLMLIGALFGASEAVKHLQPGQLLVDAPGLGKYAALTMLFIGLFLDEMPIVSFFVLPLVFWSAFVPGWPWTRTSLVAFIKNGLFFSIPVLAFLVVVVVIAPPVIQYFFGFTFDYLGDTLLVHGNTRTAPSLEVAVTAGLNPEVLLGNFTTLFGLSLAPWFTSPLVMSPHGNFPATQVTNLPKIITFVVFFGAAVYVAIKARGPLAVHLRGLLVALPLFIVFLSLLMIRHIPIVTGYYYGAIFASLFALLVGLLLAGVSQVMPFGRTIAALAVAVIVGIQIANFGPINDGWRTVHDETLTRNTMAKARTNRDRRIPIIKEQRELSPGEVRAIWDAWQKDRLDRYLR